MGRGIKSSQGIGITIALIISIIVCSYQSIKLRGNEVSDIDIYEPKNILIYEYTDWENIDYGDLYYQPINREKEFIAHNVYYECCIAGQKTDYITYIDLNNDLYLVKYGEEPKKIHSDVSISYLSFDEDKLLLFFKGNDDISYIYDIEQKKAVTLGQHILSDSSISSQYYYVDNNFDFYRLGNEKKEKIAEGVQYFDVLEDNYYLFNMREGGSKLLHIQDGITTEEDIGEHASMIYYDPESQMMIFSRWRWGAADNRFYSLDIKLPGQEAIEIDDYIIQYEYCPESRNLYYVTGDEGLFSMSLPQIDESISKDRGHFEKLLNEQRKLREKGYYLFSLSPDHKNILIKDGNHNIYLLKDNGKIKVASDCQRAEIFNDYIYFVTDKDELFIQGGINANTLLGIRTPICIAEDVIAYSNLNVTATPEGKYLSYYIIDEKGKVSLVRYEKGKGSQIILDNADLFDAEVFMGNIYYGNMMYADIKGTYYCPSLNCLMMIDDDGYFKVYSEGTEKGKIKIDYGESVNRHMMYIHFDQNLFKLQLDSGEEKVILEDEDTITKEKDGSCKISNDDSTRYVLLPISTEEFEQRLKE